MRSLCRACLRGCAWIIFPYGEVSQPLFHHSGRHSPRPPLHQSVTCHSHLPLRILLLLPVGHRIHPNKGLKDDKRSKNQSVVNKRLHDESREHSAIQSRTWSGWRKLSNGATLLDPLGLSLLPVMPFSHFSTVSSSTSSGWIRVESSIPEYIHIGWSRAWSGWMRHLRKTSNRSIPVTPSQTSWTTRSTYTFTYAFSSGITFKAEGFSTRAMEKAGSPVD